MNDTKTHYQATGAPPPLTLEALRNRPCALPFTDENYTPPTPQEIDQLIKLAGWSQNDAAKLIGVSWDTKRGSSTIRKWKTEDANNTSRGIPYSAWRLMLIYAGVVAPEEALAAINKNKNLR